MRFGLVGTGFWARTVHAVAFAVPPDVQADVAERAARAGRHLLLEKPLATRPDDADRLVGAVAGSGVSSVVFFTGRFLPELRAWIDEVRGERWHGAWAVWLGSAFASDSPFRDSPWRRDKGGLWDVGPHALSLLTAALGPVRRITADRGTRDVVHLVLHHENAATSTVTVTLSAPTAAACSALTLWGEPGRSTMPTPTGEAVDAYRTALAELVAAARADRADHPSDVRYGARVVHLLADAERQLDYAPVTDGDRAVWPDP